MIEAMAAGTPIIAGSCGSVPVVIEDGLTGFVVSSEMEAVDAIGRVHRLDPGPYPKKVRAEIRARHMAEEYIGCYQRLLGVRRNSSNSDTGVRSSPQRKAIVSAGNPQTPTVTAIMPPANDDEFAAKTDSHLAGSYLCLILGMQALQPVGDQKPRDLMHPGFCGDAKFRKAVEAVS